MPSIKAIVASSLALLATTASAVPSYETQRALFKLAKAGVTGDTEHGHIMANPHIKEEFLEADAFTRSINGQVKKITYGPYSVPPMSQNNGMKTFFSLSFPTPCSDCYVYAVQAGMEFTNGNYANANTSLWLHHMVVWDNSRSDTVCGPSYYGMGNRWFASGNERTAIDTSMMGGLKAGYYLPAGNGMHMLTELMNQRMDVTQNGQMTVTYKYVQGKPAGWSDVNTYWLDISGCMGASDMPAKNQDGSFSYQMSPGYTPAAGQTGQLIEVGGHLHDGGTNLQIMRNNKMLCNSRAYYGGSPGYYDQANNGGSMSTGSSGSSSSSGGSSGLPGWLTGLFGNSKRDVEARKASKTMSHISTMWGCVGPSIGAVSTGDNWNINAMYDYKYHAGMKDNSGQQLPVMGIAVMYSAKTATSAQIKAAAKAVKKYPYGVSQAPGAPVIGAGATSGSGSGGMGGMGGMSGM